MVKFAGPYAEFGIIDDFDKTKNYSKYEPEKYNCISIHDGVIDDWWATLTNMKSYFHSFNRPSKALARSGVTLIPPESLDMLYHIIKTQTSPLYSKEISNGLSALLALVKKAKDEGKFVIHFGV
jgi:hypothetical protein